MMSLIEEKSITFHIWGSGTPCLHFDRVGSLAVGGSSDSQIPIASGER